MELQLIVCLKWKCRSFCSTIQKIKIHYLEHRPCQERKNILCTFCVNNFNILKSQVFLIPFFTYWRHLLSIAELFLWLAKKILLVININFYFVSSSNQTSSGIVPGLYMYILCSWIRTPFLSFSPFNSRKNNNPPLPAQPESFWLSCTQAVFRLLKMAGLFPAKARLPTERLCSHLPLSLHPPGPP